MPGPGPHPGFTAVRENPAAYRWAPAGRCKQAPVARRLGIEPLVRLMSGALFSHVQVQCSARRRLRCVTAGLSGPGPAGRSDQGFTASPRPGVGHHYARETGEQPPTLAVIAVEFRGDVQHSRNSNRQNRGRAQRQRVVSSRCGMMIYPDNGRGDVCCRLSGIFTNAH
jgi:hypothetical protein